MARTVEYTVTFEVPDDTTDDEIADILGAAEIQIIDAEILDPDDPFAMNTYMIHTTLQTSEVKIDGVLWSEYENDEKENG